MSRKPYQARGVAAKFLLAVAADPTRIWTSAEACEVMGIAVRRLYATMAYPVHHQLVYQARRGGRLVLSGVPFEAEQMVAPVVKEYTPRRQTAVGWLTTEDDPRVPKVVPGWTPPKMVCARLAA